MTRLFCLLARYDSLSGDTHGFQGAVPRHVFDELSRSFGVRHECFASPLNCFMPRFCSLFPDTDGFFGSAGNFFKFRPEEVCLCLCVVPVVVH